MSIPDNFSQWQHHERHERNSDPVVIGTCAACGYPIYSNEEYFVSNDEMIHAEGVGANAKIVGTETSVPISCLFLYLQQDGMEEEAAHLFGIERVKA